MGKPKYSEQNLFHCDFVHHKSHMDCSGIKPFINRVRVYRNGQKDMIISLMIKIVYINAKHNRLYP